MRHVWITAAPALLVGLAIGAEWAATNNSPRQQAGVSPRISPTPSPSASPSASPSPPPSSTPSPRASPSEYFNEAQLADLQSSIQQQQVLIANIDSQLRETPEVNSAEQRAQEFQVNQQNAILQQQFQSNEQEIRQQQQILASLQSRVKSTLAPDDSDTRLDQQIADAQSQIASLRQSNASLQDAQAQNLQQGMDTQCQRLQSRQSDQADLIATRAQAQAELDRLNLELQTLQTPSG